MANAITDIVKAQPWFHDVSKTDAEALLASLENADGTFLVRSHKDPTKFVLSVGYKTKPTHHLGVVADENISVNGKAMNVSSLPELINKLKEAPPKGWPVLLTKTPDKSPIEKSSVSDPNSSGNADVLLTVRQGEGGYGMTVVNNGRGNFVTRLKKDLAAAKAFAEAGLNIKMGLRFVSINGTDVWKSPKNACTKIMKSADSVDLVLRVDHDAYEETVRLMSPPQSPPSSPSEVQGSDNIYDVAPAAAGSSKPPARPERPSKPSSDSPPVSNDMHFGDPLWLHLNSPSRDTVVELLKEGGFEQGLFLVRRKGPKMYCLDMVAGGKTSHHLIKPHPETGEPCISGEKSLSAPSVNELIEFLHSAPEDVWPVQPKSFVPTVRLPGASTTTSLSEYLASDNGQVPSAPQSSDVLDDSIREEESRPADGVITDITSLPLDTKPPIYTAPPVQRDQVGTRKASPEEIEAAGKGISSRFPRSPKVPPAVEAARKTLHESVQVLSAVRQDRLHEAVAKYVNRKWELEDLVIALDEIISVVKDKDRLSIEDALCDLMPLSQRDRYRELLTRAKAEAELQKTIDETPLEVHAALSKVVASTLQRIRGDKRRPDQISSFERRVQLASIQRGYAHLVVQASSAGPFDIEKVAKHVHIGWARAVTTSWAPEYGLEPLGELSIGPSGALDAFNFSTVQGYKIYLQRLALGRQRYLLPSDKDDADLIDVPQVPEPQKHFYRIAAEMILDSYFKMHPREVEREVIRMDKFACIELNQLGVVGAPGSPNHVHNRSSLDLSGTGGSIRASQSAVLSLSGLGDNLSEGDSSITLDSPPWFHGELEKSVAAHMLEKESDGTFMVRKRPFFNDHALDFKHEGRVTHHLITLNNESHILNVGGVEVVKGAKSLPELIAGLYQQQVPWPTPLLSFIPRFGVSAASISAEQIKLTGVHLSTNTPSRDGRPSSTQSVDDVDWSNSVGVVQATKEFEVVLTKGDGPLGLTLIGNNGEGDTRQGVFVSKVKPGTPAAEHSQIEVGVRILEVNGNPSLNATRSDVVNNLKVKKGSTVKLTMRNDRGAWKMFQHMSGKEGKGVTQEEQDVYGVVQQLSRRSSTIEDAEGEEVPPTEYQHQDPRPNEDYSIEIPEVSVDASDDVQQQGSEQAGEEIDTPSEEPKGEQAGEEIDTASEEPTGEYVVCFKSGKKTGMTLVNNGHGTFVLKYKEGGAFETLMHKQQFSAADLVAVGLRIESIAGDSVKDLSKAECSEKLKQLVNVTVSFKEDAQGFKATKTATEEVVSPPSSIIAGPQPSDVSTTVAGTATAGPFTQDNLGARVTVTGYDCPGTLRFVGNHAENGEPRCGIELDQAIGKNNGTVKGHKYFECASKHGCLVHPKKVKLIEGSASANSNGEPELSPPTSTDTSNPFGLAQNEIEVRLTKGSTGFAMSLGENSNKDVFITKAKPGGAGDTALSQAGLHVSNGLQILSINGANLVGSGKSVAVGQLKSIDQAVLILKKNPEGHASVLTKGKSAAVETAPPEQAPPAIGPDQVMIKLSKTTGGFGLSLGEAAGGTYITKAKEGGVGAAGLASAGVSIEDGLCIQSVNDTNLAGARKSAVTGLLKTLNDADIIVKRDPEGFAHIVARAEAKKQKSASALPQVETPTAPASAPEVASPTSEFDGMGRMALIKHLRGNGVDYSQARDVEELRQLAIQHSGGESSAAKEAPSDAGTQSEFDTMGKLAIIKFLRSKDYQDYRGKPVEELREIAKSLS